MANGMIEWPAATLGEFRLRRVFLKTMRWYFVRYGVLVFAIECFDGFAISKISASTR
jgi:hypothetical protein